MLAATLLSDWVFTQNPKSVKQVVELLLDGIGLRYLLASGAHGRRRRGTWTALALPPRCGREEVVTRCFELLRVLPAPDYADELISVVKANASNIDELVERWTANVVENDARRMRIWPDYGVDLGVLSRIDSRALWTSLQQGGISEWPTAPLYRSRRLDILESTETEFQAAVDGILDRHLVAQPQRRVESALDALSHALDPYRYSAAFMERAPIPLTGLLERRGRPTNLKWSSEIATNTEAYSNHKKCISIATLAENLCERSAAEWATEIEPWEELIELGRATWGERWVFSCLANLAAGIRSNTERCKEYPDLDHSRSLCRRARHARLKSGVKSWWVDQFRGTHSTDDQRLVCLLALTWATPTTLVLIHDELDSCLTSLDQRSWYRIARETRRTLSATHVRKPERKEACGWEV